MYIQNENCITLSLRKLEKGGRKRERGNKGGGRKREEKGGRGGREEKKRDKTDLSGVIINLGG